MNKRTIKLAAYIVGSLGVLFIGYRAIFGGQTLAYKLPSGERRKFRRPLSQESAAAAANDCASSRQIAAEKVELWKALREDGYSDLAAICEGSTLIPPTNVMFRFSSQPLR